MSDDKVREIQLGGKQLVFLFMTAVVLAVAIFLLGISVGRGVGAPPSETTAAADVPVGEPIPAEEMPPPTTTTPADLGYHDELQGQPPPPPAEPAPPTTEPATPPKPAPVPPATATTAAPAASKPGATAASGGWFVQVNAFKSRQNADRQAAELRAKGYSALVQADPGALFRVRIGPFADRPEADRTAQRVRTEEGISATVQR